MTVEAIHDGDTITGSIYLGWGVALSHRRIRFDGFDAWETTRARRTVTITEEELLQGKLATQTLKELLAQKPLLLSIGEREFDPYGRVLGVPYLRDSKDTQCVHLGNLMTLLGHSRD